MLHTLTDTISVRTSKTMSVPLRSLQINRGEHRRKEMYVFEHEHTHTQVQGTVVQTDQWSD